MTNHIHSRSLASELPRPGLCAGWDFTGVLRDATPQCSFDYLNVQLRIDSGEGWWIAAVLPVVHPVQLFNLAQWLGSPRRSKAQFPRSLPPQ